jgi:cysteinyl-tRNA synthetase
MIKDVLNILSPRGDSSVFMSNHYRSPIDYSQSAMDESVVAWIRPCPVERVDDSIGTKEAVAEPTPSGAYWDRFCEAMDDDFNSARGIGVLFEAVRNINRIWMKTRFPCRMR